MVRIKILSGTVAVAKDGVYEQSNAEGKKHIEQMSMGEITQYGPGDEIEVDEGTAAELCIKRRININGHNEYIARAVLVDNDYEYRDGYKETKEQKEIANPDAGVNIERHPEPKVVRKNEQPETVGKPKKKRR